MGRKKQAEEEYTRRRSMSFGAARETVDRRPEDRGQSLRDQQKNGRNGGKMGKEAGFVETTPRQGRHPPSPLRHAQGYGAARKPAEWQDGKRIKSDP